MNLCDPSPSLTGMKQDIFQFYAIIGDVMHGHGTLNTW